MAAPPPSFSPDSVFEQDLDLQRPLGEGTSFTQLKPLSELGAGDFCTVHTATLCGSMVALKRLRKDLAPEREKIGLADLRREVAVLTRINHPHIIRLVAHGIADDGSPFCCLTMFSQPLGALLPTGKVGFFAERREAKEWPLARAVAVGLQLARALRYCHDEFLPGYRLLHRDIKPNNVGVFSDGRVVLADFGLLSLWKKDAEDDAAVRPLTGMTGSLRYMAPEVALSQPYNHKAEVFSFTSLLYHMLSRRKPFEFMTPSVFLREACRGGNRPPLGKAWPAQLRGLVAAGWSAELAERPEFEAVVRALEAMPREERLRPRTPSSSGRAAEGREAGGGGSPGGSGSPRSERTKWAAAKAAVATGRLRQAHSKGSLVSFNESQLEAGASSSGGRLRRVQSEGSALSRLEQWKGARGGAEPDANAAKGEVVGGELVWA